MQQHTVRISIPFTLPPKAWAVYVAERMKREYPLLLAKRGSRRWQESRLVRVDRRRREIVYTITDHRKE